MADGIWGDIPTWVGVIGAGITAAVGLREFAASQRWKQSEFLADEVDRFFAHPRVSTALLLIDYSEIKLDERGQRPQREAADTFIFTDDNVAWALRVHTDFTDGMEDLNAHEMLARESFDQFLTGLERFGHHVDVGLISVDNVRAYLGYWTKRVADPSTAWKKPAFYKAFARFAHKYQYHDAIRLCAALGTPLREPVQD